MAKGQLCITTYVFGEAYQQFIPLFIYSVLKSYPDYYPIIFCAEKLTPKVNSQLSLIKNMGEFKVVEDKKIFTKNQSRQQGSSARWFLYDKEFTNYEAVYIGDIDILILKEDIPLFEQHMNHCEVINLPYSNVIRVREVNLRSTKIILSRLKSFGPFGLLSIHKKTLITKRLSGLHFVITDSYFPAIKQTANRYKQIITKNDLLMKKITQHHGEVYNDECLLFDIVKESGLGLPPIGPYGTFMLDYRNYKSPWFRPHHGIHLGIFRNQSIKYLTSQVLETDVYKEYYKQFKEKIYSDNLFLDILSNSSQGIKKAVQDFINYYEHK